MTNLYFCRHGESQANHDRVYAGQFDTPLTDLGRDQAKVAGESAKPLPIDLIVTSKLSRAVETAQIIADTIGYDKSKIISNAVFNERDLSALTGKSWDEVDEDNPDHMYGVETFESLEARAQQGLDILKSLDADTILLVGHGSSGRALHKVITGQDSPELPNAQIVKLI